MIQTKFYLILSYLKQNSLSSAAMDTTMEVDVDEDCTRTVAKTPIIKSAMGFDKILLLVNAFPAALPASW